MEVIPSTMHTIHCLDPYPRVPYASRGVPASRAVSIGCRPSEMAAIDDPVEVGCDKRHAVASTRKRLSPALSLGSDLKGGGALAYWGVLSLAHLTSNAPMEESPGWGLNSIHGMKKSIRLAALLAITTN